MLFKQPFRQPHAPQSKGFTLTELAIVIGIIGILMGAVWIAASNLYGQKKVTQTTTDILYIIQGVRSLYATAMVTGDPDGTTETSNYSNAGVFPSDMGATTAWGNGTSVMVTSQSKPGSAANTGDAFEIEFNGIPASACAALLLAIAGPSHDSGLFYANASAAAQGAAALAATTTIPVTADAANAACAAAATVSIQFAFNLKG